MPAARLLREADCDDTANPLALANALLVINQAVGGKSPTKVRLKGGLGGGDSDSDSDLDSDGTASVDDDGSGSSDDEGTRVTASEVASAATHTTGTHVSFAQTYTETAATESEAAQSQEAASSALTAGTDLVEVLPGLTRKSRGVKARPHDWDDAMTDVLSCADTTIDHFDAEQAVGGTVDERMMVQWRRTLLFKLGKKEPSPEWRHQFERIHGRQVKRVSKKAGRRNAKKLAARQAQHKKL
eukprot:SAG22_NODE_1106_length_5552_cov_3.049331_2_plen_242_part_00